MLYPDFNELVAFRDRKSNLQPPSFRLVKSSATGNHHSPFRGQGLEFDSVREYVPGDDIRNIDWRVTARTGSPHLKLFKEDRERHIVICVDMNAAMRFGTRNTFKSIQAARITALLGWQGIARQDRVSACLFGDVADGIQYFAPKRNRKSLCTLLKTLSEPPVTQHRLPIPIADVIQHINKAAHTGALIYFISDFMDFGRDLQHLQQETLLSRLSKRCDVVFIAINDPADKSLVPVGTLGFRGQDAEKIYVNTESISGRDAYESQWKENRQRLYALSFKFSIPIIELSTESDVIRELTLGMKTIEKRKKR